jgi:hypothetical protein
MDAVEEVRLGRDSVEATVDAGLGPADALKMAVV